MKVVAAVAIAALFGGFALRSLQPQPQEAPSYVAPVRTGTTLDSVAALSLRHPERIELLYVRMRGRWRCATAFGAPVLEPDLVRVVASLQNGQGLVRSQPQDELDLPAIGVGLHGPGVASAPDRDLQASYDLASRGSSSWVRPTGQGWLEVPDDFAALLTWPADASLPPLVDDHLVACAWPQGFPGIERVFIDRQGGQELELFGTATEAGDETWQVRDEAGLHAVLPYRLAGYFNYLLRVRYRGLADPRRKAEQGLDAPWATVTLALTDGEVVTLRVGDPAGAPNGGGIFVENAALPLLGQVGAEDPAWLAPTTVMLIEKSTGNPWEQWLTR